MDTPTTCLHCGDPIDPDDARSQALASGVHWECQLRLVVGSVAHQNGQCACVAPFLTDNDDPALTRHQAAWVAVRLYLEREAKGP